MDIQEMPYKELVRGMSPACAECSINDMCLTVKCPRPAELLRRLSEAERKDAEVKAAKWNSEQTHLDFLRVRAHELELTAQLAALQARYDKLTADLKEDAELPDYMQVYVRVYARSILAAAEPTGGGGR